MKKNAQKILLCLYVFSNQEQALLTDKQLRIVLPDMTEGGFRSLLLFLQRKGLLIKESFNQLQYYSITERGREALNAKFPALNPQWRDWNGTWHVMTFLQAPKSDPQFRYLRQLLIADHVLPMTRGVYLAAGGFSSEVLTTCSSLYADCVVIFSVANWEFGLIRPIVVKYYDLASVASLYSSISKSLEQLLEIFNSDKSSTNQQKMNISTTIDRLWSGLKEDPGFASYYFPDLPDIRLILKQLFQLLKI